MGTLGGKALRHYSFSLLISQEQAKIYFHVQILNSQFIYSPVNNIITWPVLQNPFRLIPNRWNLPFFRDFFLTSKEERKKIKIKKIPHF